MTTKRSVLITALALASALGGVGVSAQGVTPSADPGDTHTVAVTFGEFTYSLFADEPVQACVTARAESSAGVSLTYRLFVREPDGSFSSVGSYASPEIGALDGAQFGDCTSLEAVSNAG